MALRLGFTCWLVYTLHFATNMVRENYLALAIGDDFSFRVDPYAGLHDDIFEHPGHGWHIGSNPGASMVGAIPYAFSRPLIDRIVASVQRARHEAGRVGPPHYDAPTEKDRRFYETAWRRGVDVKFGLASFVMQSFAMAVVSALGVVVMYLLLAGHLGSSTTALFLAILYAFGTPVFFRTGFLNHNLMLAHAGLFGFAVLGNRWNWSGATRDRIFGLAGLAGGFSVLLDYSGLVFLGGLWIYGLLRYRREIIGRAWLRPAFAYAAGAVGPLVLLWLYQWRSFGHAFLPPQHWMPLVEWSDQGYQGIVWPQLPLAGALAFDYRFGLFVSCPLFLLAFAAPFVDRRPRHLPGLDLGSCLAFFLAFLVFFSCVHYTRWQFNTGVRYLAAVFPFLFLPVAVVLLRLPPLIGRLIGVGSIVLAWSMAMARDVSGGKVDLADPDTGLGVLDPLLTVLVGGFKLPALTTLSRMEQFGDVARDGVSPLPLLLFAAALLLVVWMPRKRE
ncbi:MAG TPA: hypothetical protein VFV05_26705 [Methylomirabilota bacterium]|nr:hypothetical protein [Methylomirabilota bacterium]